jgi:hypothetical protein
MNFPVDGLRRSYLDRKDRDAVRNIDDEDLEEIGLTKAEVLGK